MAVPAASRAQSGRLLRLPSVQALLIQFAALGLAALPLLALAQAGIGVAPLAAALLQGALAALLSLTRAWTLVRFFQSKMLEMATCDKCKGKFVINGLDLNQSYLCGLCHMPSRAGKTKKARDDALAA